MKIAGTNFEARGIQDAAAAIAAGADMTPEAKAAWKQKISSSTKGRKQTVEFIEKRAAALRGKPLTLERRAKISAAHIAYHARRKLMEAAA